MCYVYPSSWAVESSHFYGAWGALTIIWLRMFHKPFLGTSRRYGKKHHTKVLVREESISCATEKKSNHILHYKFFESLAREKSAQIRLSRKSESCDINAVWVFFLPSPNTRQHYLHHRVIRSCGLRRNGQRSIYVSKSVGADPTVSLGLLQ